MFDTLSDRLCNVLYPRKGRGGPTDADNDSAMREGRVALRQAAGRGPVARDFVESVSENAGGKKVLSSVTPGRMVVKCANTAPVETLGSEISELSLSVAPPAVVMMVGLQGS